MRRWLLAVLIASMLLCPGPTDAAPLRVGVVGFPPFLMRTPDGRPDGLVIELWREIASSLSLEYDSRFLPNVDTGIDLLNQGKLDVLVGPVSITADRSQKASFTQPWYRAGLAILAPRRPPSLLARIRPFLSRAFLIAGGVLLVLLFIVGTLVWMAECRQNPQHFPRRWVEGIGNGMWLALVTMTTVGYGDRVPYTGLGRTITGVWMLITAVTASTLTAGLATAFTLSQFDAPALATPEQLQGRRVAVTEGTVALEFVLRHGGRVVPVADVDHAIQDLLADRAEAAVFDRPSLEYALHLDPRLPLSVSSTAYDTQDFGFALHLGSPHVHKINIAMLRFLESGGLTRLERKWLGTSH